MPVIRALEEEELFEAAYLLASRLKHEEPASRLASLQWKALSAKGQWQEAQAVLPELADPEEQGKASLLLDLLQDPLPGDYNRWSLLSPPLKRLALNGLYSQGRIAKGLMLVHKWCEDTRDPGELLQLARSLSSLADRCLEAPAEGMPFECHRDLLVDTRRSLPYSGIGK
ncbi:hypothetical protein D3C75_970240 [compost metagenome]